MALMKPFAFLVIALAAGAALALASLATHLPTGWIGAISLVGWAAIARRRWSRLEATSGLEPGAPERILWLRLSGVALILGHLTAAILLVRDDLRLGSGNSLAIDDWTIIAGHQIAAFVFRADFRERDERHAPIVARGVRVGWGTLLVALLPLIAWMAFTPYAWRGALTHFMLANTIIALMVVSYAAMLLAQLFAYAKDTRRIPDQPPVR